MKKLIMFNLVSLDGLFAGPDGELDWHNVDPEFHAFAIEQFHREAIDTLLFGRITYQLMAAYWPTPAARTNDPAVAAFMNDTAKLVFSRTLTTADWRPTRFLAGDAAEKVAAWKEGPGANGIVLGSAALVAALMSHGLIDEYRLMVNPVVLGRGRPLFAHAGGRHRLRLVSTKIFRSGNVLLVYQPN